MEVKYLINLLREYARSENDIPLCPDEAVNIIIYLQQGEKYRQIWEEFRDNRPRQIGTYWEKYINKLEQKYFPKEEGNNEK